MVPFLALHLDRRSRDSLQRQLYEELRAAILAGRLAPGARLPASRVLAGDLAVSRNTVAGAFDQLLAEGYVEGKVGSGTYVAGTLPEELLRVSSHGAANAGPLPMAKLSRRGRVLAAIPVSFSRDIGAPRAFRPGIPALDRFPREIWARLTARLVRHAPVAMLNYGDPTGYRPLRQGIAEYVRAARGVRCSADQIIVTAGSQQALDLAARVLLDPGDTAWVEDPGYLGERGALAAAGIRCAPIPVDDEGISVVEGVLRAPEARLASVTPSHQYPLGVTMSLARRMGLLAWARRRRAWIVEDDYDSEFRYAGRPLPALQGLDSAGRVIYMGTFSKVLCPSLRLGYLVCPEPLVAAFTSARALVDRHSPGIEQVVLAEFLSEGHFARHVRRMRALYAERQQVLVIAAQRELAGLLEILPAEAGLHLTAWLPPGANDRDVSDQAAAVGIIAPPLSAYTIDARIRPGLMLGYAALPARQIREGVRKLALVLNSGCNSRPPGLLRLPRLHL
jgi:GntR family transcriptional regulator/MocR family aminotransferase